MKVSELFVRYIDGHEWELKCAFEVDFEGELGLSRVVVPRGFVTDFNSIPRFFWRVAPPTEFGEAAVVHDYLYRKDSDPLVDRKTADRAHRALMKWRGAAWFRHWTYFRLLRAFAGGAYHKKTVEKD